MLKVRLILELKSEWASDCKTLYRHIELPFAPFVGLKLHLNTVSEGPAGRYSELWDIMYIPPGYVEIEQVHYALGLEEFDVYMEVDYSTKERVDAAIEMYKQFYGFKESDEILEEILNEPDS